MPSCLKLILLDFDGVIVESVGIKDRAFEALYSDYPETLERIMEYHLSHNATIRFEKFRYIAEKILHQPYSVQEEERLSKAFAELVSQKIIECPFVEGAIDFLETFSVQVPLYLVSMSPQAELDRILEARQLKSYFKKVYAFPMKKSEAFQEIIANEQCLPENIVYIGDTPEDYQAAQVTNVPFVGRKSQKSFGSAPITAFDTMTDIQTYLTRHYSISK